MRALGNRVARIEQQRVAQARALADVLARLAGGTPITALSEDDLALLVRAPGRDLSLFTDEELERLAAGDGERTG